MSTDQSSATGTQNDDVTREQLAAAEARFTGIVEISADAVISVDEDQRIILFNQGAEEIFGYAAGEAIGRPLDILLPERFRTAHRRHVGRFGAGHERARRMGERTAIAGLRKDGSEFPAEASISKYTVGGRTVYNVVLRDISDRARAAERQRLMATTGELLASGVDLAATIAKAARLAIPTLGSACIVDAFAIEEAPEPACAHVSPERARELAAVCRERPLDVDTSPALAEAIEAGVPLVRRAQDLLPADQLRRVIEAAAGPGGAGVAAVAALVARGRGLGIFVLCRQQRSFDEHDLHTIADLARLTALAIDNARLYEEAQRAIRARDQTVAVVSHDLRNPINAIRMIAGNMASAEPARGDPGLTESVQVIQQAARQADRLIQDLLDVARIEGGRLRLTLEETPVLPVLNDALEVMSPLAQERGVTLRAELPPDDAVAVIDAPRVHQVVGNVVGNAIKFTPRGGEVVLRAEFRPETLVVSVRDTGVGIAPESLPHVFDRFWQGHGDRRGSGLGLTIAKGIVDAHGGCIRIASTPAAGTTVTFELPRGTSAARRQ